MGKIQKLSKEELISLLKEDLNKGMLECGWGWDGEPLCSSCRGPSDNGTHLCNECQNESLSKITEESIRMQSSHGHFNN